MKNRDVIKDFIKGYISSTRNVISTGVKLYSYRTCIAEKINGVLVLNLTKYSTTTSRHQHYLKEYSKNISTVELYDVPINTPELWIH